MSTFVGANHKSPVAGRPTGRGEREALLQPISGPLRRNPVLLLCRTTPRGLLVRQRDEHVRGESLHPLRRDFWIICHISLVECVQCAACLTQETRVIRFYNERGHRQKWRDPEAPTTPCTPTVSPACIPSSKGLLRAKPRVQVESSVILFSQSKFETPALSSRGSASPRRHRPGLCCFFCHSRAF